MTYEERYEAVFLARSFEVLRRLARRARVLADSPAPDHMLRSLAGLIRPAEILLRRVLVVMALGLNLVAPSPRASGGAKSDHASPRALPGFRLIEPFPSTTAYDQRRPVCTVRPRIRSFDDPAQPDPPPQRPATARIVARLEALEAIIADPDRAARRLGLWFARRRPGLRNTPLKLGRPSIHRKSEWARPIKDAQHFAHCAMDRRHGRLLAPCDTS